MSVLQNAITQRKQPIKQTQIVGQLKEWEDAEKVRPKLGRFRYRRILQTIRRFCVFNSVFHKFNDYINFPIFAILENSIYVANAIKLSNKLETHATVI